VPLLSKPLGNATKTKFSMSVLELTLPTGFKEISIL
jgi:hypothetical protein